MSFINHKHMAKMVQYTLQLMFILGIFTIVFLKPILLRFFGYAYYSYSAGYFDFMLIILYICGPLSLTVLWQIISVLKTINNGNPFIHKNGQCLKRLGVACFFIALAFFVNCCLYISPFAIILCIVFVIAGFFGLIFGDLFHQAAKVKEENDLTI